MARSWDPTTASVASGSTINVNALVATTLPKVRPSIVDNFFEATPFFSFMRKKNRVIRWTGGATIEQPVLYDKNPYAKAYDPYENMDVGPPQGFGTTVWKMPSYRVPITYSRRSKVANSGKEAVVDMINGFKMQAEKSLVDKVNTNLMQEQTGTSWTTKEIIPLSYIIEAAAKDSQDSVVGGIDKADASSNNLSKAWRNQYYNMSGGTAPLGLSAIRKTYYACCKGNTRPNIGLCDTESFRLLEEQVYSSVRFVNPETVDWGFDAIKYKGTWFFFDKDIDDYTNGQIFLLNTDFLKLMVGDANFQVIPPEWDKYQDAYVGLIMVDIQLIATNLARQGVISHTATSGNWS